MSLWDEATQTGPYRRRPLPRNGPPSWHNTSREPQVLARIKALLRRACQEAFTRGTDLAEEFLLELEREDQFFQPGPFIFSHASLSSVPARYRDAVAAVMLYGVVVGLRQYDVRSIDYPSRAKLRTNTVRILVLLQQLLTRSWMRFTLQERLFVLDDWYRGQPYHRLVREEWNQACVGAARVANTGLALPMIHGNWKGYLSTIHEDMNSLDVVFTGRGNLDDKTWVRMGFLVQVKGGKEDDIHVVQRMGLAPPKTVDQHTWTRLQELWNVARDVYNRIYEFVPVLVTVGTNSKAFIHNLEDRAPLLAGAIQRKFS